MTTALTVAEFKEALPGHIKKVVTPELMKQINSAIADPEAMAVFRENVVGLASVMKEGKFKLSDYLHAVHYVSYKLLGNTQVQAWAKTFGDRYNRLVRRNAARSEIAAIASRYNSSKLVTLLLGQTLVPTHILNAPLFQEAINVQAELMRTAKSEKVRSDTARNLAELLKPPETKKIELEMNMQEDESLSALKATSLALVKQQKRMIEEGRASVRNIAESRLVGEGSTQKVIDVSSN